MADGRPDDAAPDYVPIEDYGAIGNLLSVALVSRTGSIDWCCLPRLDSPGVFAAILDRRRGGRFSLRPRGVTAMGDQRYMADTNVLETWWEFGGTRLTITDFMPLRGSILRADDPPTAPRIYRIVRCEGGDCEVELEWSPRFDYARGATRMEIDGGSAIATGDEATLSLSGVPVPIELELTEHGPVARATFRVRGGDAVPLLTWHGTDETGWPRDDWEAAQRETVEAWREWLHERDEGEVCDFAGEWQGMVSRSGLALKLLTFPRTGAIAAAATTSLPEQIGGVRNWDYRYTWIRDASFTAQALVALGHRAEAIDFIEWAEHTCMRDAERPGHLHLMYTLDGDPDILEVELDHLEGYRGSRPVRIGNKASGQFQLDIYGELLNAVWELTRIGGTIDADRWRFLTLVADQACMFWRKPDYGIWEVRSEPQHFVYSKLMVWVALDRAIRIAERYALDGPIEQWRQTLEAVREEILDLGFDEGLNTFVQAYGTQRLDAANLLVGIVGLLPMSDPRVQGTIDATLERLTENDLVYRYLADEEVDGIAGHDGAFGLTTFWLVDALALSGRIAEARRIFEKVARRANHLGLYSEEFDPRTGAFLGNFPQAFTHIGFINSAVYLAYAEGRQIPSPAPFGSAEEAEERESSARHTNRE